MVLKIRDALKGDHVHVDFFVGPDADHLVLAGTLVFRIPEWAAVGVTLAFGSAHVGENVQVVGSDGLRAATQEAAAAVGAWRMLSEENAAMTIAFGAYSGTWTVSRPELDFWEYYEEHRENWIEAARLFLEVINTAKRGVKLG
jgi:hypothetical protein